MKHKIYYGKMRGKEVYTISREDYFLGYYWEDDKSQYYLIREDNSLMCGRSRLGWVLEENGERILIEEPNSIEQYIHLYAWKIGWHQCRRWERQDHPWRQSNLWLLFVKLNCWCTNKYCKYLWWKQRKRSGKPSPRKNC